jgi:hypothetical protein
VSRSIIAPAKISRQLLQIGLTQLGSYKVTEKGAQAFEIAQNGDGIAHLEC